MHYWRAGCKTLNYGEALAVLIVHKLGYEPIDKGKGRCLLSIGSELHAGTISKVRKEYGEPVIWGYGYSAGDAPDLNGLDVRAVRGPLTSRTLKLPSGTPQGDPAFLLPRLIPERHRGGDGIIVVPHWSNRDIRAWPEYPQLDIEITYDDVMSFIRSLLSADFVLTNSLHVVITCLAYRIPFAPVQRDGEIFNKPLKWSDTFEWAGIPLARPWPTTIDEAIIWYSRARDYDLPDVDDLLNAFPSDIFG